MDLVRTDAEIAALDNAVVDAIDAGTSRYPGKSYEEGVRDTLAWLAGDDEEPPVPLAD